MPRPYKSLQERNEELEARLSRFLVNKISSLRSLADPSPYQLSRYSREMNEKTLTIKENNKGQIFNQKLTVTEFLIIFGLP